MLRAMVCSSASSSAESSRPGEDDHGNIGQRVVVADAVEHLEAAHVGQPQVEHDAIAGVFAQRRERACAGVGGDDLDIVVIEQFA